VGAGPVFDLGVARMHAYHDGGGGDAPCLIVGIGYAQQGRYQCVS